MILQAILGLAEGAARTDHAVASREIEVASDAVLEVCAAEASLQVLAQARPATFVSRELCPALNLLYVNLMCAVTRRPIRGVLTLFPSCWTSIFDLVKCAEKPA